MSSEDRYDFLPPVPIDAISPFSWWSWRPGIRPIYALALGGIVSLLGLAAFSLGIVTLLAGTSDGTGSISLLLVGVLLAGYPLIITRWGLRDLFVERYARDQLCHLAAYVIATRSITSLTRRDRPGTMPRSLQRWYGIALWLINDHDTQRGQVLTLRVKEEVWRSVHEGIAVRVTFSPHLHYVYTLAIIEKPA